MGKTQPSAEFKSGFLLRTKQAREARGFTQEQMGRLLGIPQDRYKQYETRTLLPHELIPDFCKETGVDLAYLFNGARIIAVKDKKRLA